MNLNFLFGRVFGADDKLWKDATFVRNTIFGTEYHVADDIEVTDIEKKSAHFVLYNDRKPIGTGRLRVDGDYAFFERISVLPAYRNKGLGAMILTKMESVAKNRGYKQVKMHVPTTVEGFFQKYGYETVSDVFLEVNFPHVIMVKAVSNEENK